MYWETLPHWFWVIYYVLLFITLGTAIYGVVNNKLRFLSILAVIITLSAPIVSFINSVERSAGMNEMDYFIHELQHGAIWTFFTLFCYVFLLTFWWLFLFLKQ
ncbi:hypothetical protein MUN89_06715 [Halobacillus salinarum]|uniref:Uncharacterized protein n=1 Tax=Halobacillus salinarum TaxID=2932257 RepID=A0ABY4EME4_9BACI|nr:hypothetical protein [Halobacillus salinarum]UOQ45622.1 hypothetical protein MUN89_06715 [Halobacillus salinarum]